MNRKNFLSNEKVKVTNAFRFFAPRRTKTRVLVSRILIGYFFDEHRLSLQINNVKEFMGGCQPFPWRIDRVKNIPPPPPPHLLRPRIPVFLLEPAYTNTIRTYPVR